MMRISSIVALVGAWLSLSAGTDDYVRVTLETPAPSPFRLIHYEVTRRAPATTAVHRRLLPGHEESLHTLGLLTDEEADAVFGMIAEADALTLPDRVPRRGAPGQLTWRVEVMVGERVHTFRVTDPEHLEDRRYHRVIHGVRELVRATAGELPFRNVFFAPSQRGWINIVSVPAARLHVGDFDTNVDTPLYHYELAAGAHTIRLVSLDGRHDRTFEIRVEPGGTTNLRIDLR